MRSPSVQVKKLGVQLTSTVESLRYKGTLLLAKVRARCTFDSELAKYLGSMLLRAMYSWLVRHRCLHRYKCQVHVMPAWPEEHMQQVQARLCGAGDRDSSERTG